MMVIGKSSLILKKSLLSKIKKYSFETIQTYFYDLNIIKLVFKEFIN